MDHVGHFEIPVDDIDRAKTFYTSVFGWHVVDVDGMPYWFAITTPADENNVPQEKGAINGGFYVRDDQGGSRVPVPVAIVENAEASCGRVEEEGGSIVFPPQEVGDMGYYAQVKDTEGNIIGVWEPKEPTTET